jgi:hypothetical protein
LGVLLLYFPFPSHAHCHVSRSVDFHAPPLIHTKVKASARALVRIIIHSADRQQEHWSGLDVHGMVNGHHERPKSGQLTKNFFVRASAAYSASIQQPLISAVWITYDVVNVKIAIGWGGDG